jgi:low temperature requirement protein LtrA
MSRVAGLAGLAIPMRGRSPHEEHRAATPLELFFDLVFVVAVAQVSTELHNGLAEENLGRTILQYIFVFGAIWWAWIGFTWFASAYDNDDVAYRLLVFVELAGALVLAAGVPRAFEQSDWSLVLAGYVIMRLAGVALWLRAARDHPAGRPAALRFALGITVLQFAWVVMILAMPTWFVFGFMGLFLIELVIPVWAQRAARTPWHPEHIAERYGLFTIIVLGEVILAASLAVALISDEGLTTQLLGVLVGGLFTVFAMWWLYFYRPVSDLLTSLRMGFVWGYGHLPLWASAAAVGAGLALAIEAAAGHGSLDAVAAGYAVAIPVALYLGCLFILHGVPRLDRWTEGWPTAVPILAILVVPLTGWGVLLTGVVLALYLGFKLVAYAYRDSAVT